MSINQLIINLDSKIDKLINRENVLNTFKPVVLNEASIDSVSDGGTDGSGFALNTPIPYEFWNEITPINNVHDNEVIVKYKLTKEKAEELLLNDIKFTYTMIMIIQGMVTNMGKYTDLTDAVAFLHRPGSKPSYFRELGDDSGVELRLLKLPSSYVLKHNLK